MAAVTGAPPNAATTAHRKTAKMRYVTGIPRKPLPEGIVLVHNHVVPTPLLGANGFRAWTQLLTDNLELCDCDWAGCDLNGHKHYRVRRQR